jgi:hypothetical protein
LLRIANKKEMQSQIAGLRPSAAPRIGWSALRVAIDAVIAQRFDRRGCLRAANRPKILRQFDCQTGNRNAPISITPTPASHRIVERGLAGGPGL